MLSDKTAPNGEYSNLVFSGTFGQCSKSSPVKYSYFSKRSLEDQADIFGASLPKSYCAWFALILSSRILSSSVNFYKDSKKFFLNLKGSLAGNVVNLKESLAGNVVSILKKLKGSFVHSL